MKKPNMSKEALVASFGTRSFRAGGYSMAATAIVIAIAVVINVLVSALPLEITQIDTTSEGLFSLSEETETVVGALEDDITVYWVVQSGYEDSAVDKLLDRYRELSKHIEVEKIDPDVYPTFVQKYVSDGVYNNSLIVERGDRYRYIGNEAIYVYDYSNYYTSGTYSVNFAGEAELTSAIDYVTRDSMPKLYNLIGHGETALPTDFSSAVEKQNYLMEDLSLLTAETVPADADGLFIYAPQSDFSDKELEVLRAYLQDGGRLYLISQPTLSTLTNLEALMADYGVTTVDGIVVEGDQNYFAWGTAYDILPEVNSHDITSALISGGYYVRVPVAQGLTVSEALPDGVSVTELLTTTDKAFSKIAGYNLTTYEKETGDIDGPFAVSVAITDENTDASIVWVTSGYLADSQTNSEVAGGNLDFFLNGLNWLCQGEESGFTIHAKTMAYEYLTMDGGTAGLLTMLIVAVIPAVYLAVGIVIRARRKRA